MFTLQLTSEDTTFQQNKNRLIDQYLFRIAAGDQNAFSALYRATKTSVYAYALSVLKNTQDAEDVLQDCFLHVYHAANTYQSCGKPMAWIITIVRNLCLQRLREHKRFSDLPEENWEPYINSQEGISGEDRLILQECMQKLTDEERQIVILHAVAGFKHREIASVLRMPLATVLSKYNRSIKKMHSVLQNGEK